MNLAAISLVALAIAVTGRPFFEIAAQHTAIGRCIVFGLLWR